MSWAVKGLLTSGQYAVPGQSVNFCIMAKEQALGYRYIRRSIKGRVWQKERLHLASNLRVSDRRRWCLVLAYWQGLIFVHVAYQGSTRDPCSSGGMTLLNFSIAHGMAYPIRGGSYLTQSMTDLPPLGHFAAKRPATSEMLDT